MADLKQTVSQQQFNRSLGNVTWWQNWPNDLYSATKNWLHISNYQNFICKF